MARCCGCSCSATSPPSATASRCRCRVRTGGCSRSSPCTPARTSATRWPPGSGPTSRPRAPTCAPPCGRCAGRSAPTRVEATRTSVALAGAVVRDLDDARRSRAATPRSTRRLRRAGRRLGRAAARAEHLRRRMAAGSTRSRPPRTDPADAARWTARRCALTPLDEPAHRVLIERLAAAGDRAGALVAGRELAERLRAELGVGPGPGHAGGCSRACADPRPGRRCRRARGPPMFGRAAELADADRGLVGGARRDGAGSCSSPARRGSARPGWWASWPGGRTTRGRASRSARAWTSAARRRSRCGRSWRARSSTVVPRPPEPLGWPAELGRLAPDLAARAGPPGRAAAGRRAGAGAAAAVRRRAAARRVGGGGQAGAARGRGRAPGRPREPRPVRAHRSTARRAARAVRADPPRPARPLRRRRAARRPRGPRRRGHRDRARPAARARRWPRWCAASRRCPTPAVDAGGRGGRRQPAAGGGERPGGGRGQAGRRGAPGQPAGAGPGRARRAARARAGARGGHRGGGARRCRRPRSRRCPCDRPTGDAERRVLDSGLAAPRAAAACATGTRCSPRPPAPTCATRRARTWRSRWRSRRPPAPGDARARRGGPPPAAGGPRRPRRAPLAAGRPARPHARRPAGGHRVLGRGRALRPRRRRHAPRARRGARLVGPDRRVRARVGGRARLPHPRRRGGRVAPARAAPQDRRVQPGRLPRGLPPRRGAARPGRARRRCGPGCSSAWRGTRAPAGDPVAGGRPARARCGSWSRRATCRQAWRTSWWPRPSPPG